MSLILPATSCNSTCETPSTRKACQRLSACGFYWELVTKGSLCLAHTKIPDSQKESRCSGETILFYSLDIVSYFDQLWEWWKPPELQVPRCQSRANLVKQVLRISSQVGFINTFFCSAILSQHFFFNAHTQFLELYFEPGLLSAGFLIKELSKSLTHAHFIYMYIYESCCQLKRFDR